MAADVETEQAEFFFPEPRVCPELFHPLRLGFKNIERSYARRGDRRRMRSRKQEGPRAVIKIVDEVTRSANVAAESADRLRQGAHLNVYASVHRKVIDGTPSLAPENAGGVRIVDHHD